MERGVKLCVLCFNFVSNSSATEKTGGRRKPCKKVVDSRDPQTFSKFLAQLAKFSASQLELKDPDHIPVCSYCFTSIKAWVCTREKTEEQEKLVYSLQVQLLKELKILEGYLEEYSGTFKVLEDTVKNFDEIPETMDEDGGDGDGWRSEVGRVREAILGAGSSFRLRRTSPESRVEKEMEEATRRMRQEKLRRNRSAMVSDSSRSSLEQKAQFEDETETETGSSDMDVVKTEEWQVKVEDEGSDVNCALMDDVGDGDDTDDGDDAYGQESDGSDDGESESDITDKSMLGVSDLQANFLKSKGITLEGASEVRKRVILNWVREQVQAPRKRIHKREDANDDLWFKNMYKLEFSPEEGFSLAGIKIIWNEEENYFKCSLCEYRYHQTPDPGQRLKFKANMSRHILAHHLDVYKCRICGDKAKFKDGRNYRAHMMMHRGEEGAPTCDICGRVMADKRAVTTHRFTHMSAEEKEESKRNGTWRGKESKKWDPAETQCPICKKQLKSAQSLKGHLKTHKDRKEREDLVQCEDCGKTMIEGIYRRRHPKVCPGKGGFGSRLELPCPQCHKTFSSRSGLKTHIATGHSDHRPFQCEVCGMRFKIKQLLLNHMRLHSEKKEFKCERCGQEFPLKLYLKRHEKKCSLTSDHT